MDKTERESQEHIKEVGANFVSNAYALKKDKKYQEAYNILLPLLEKDEMPSYFCDAAGWVIYYYLKANLEKLQPVEFYKIMHYYLNFWDEKASMLHSYMMVLALNKEKKQKNGPLFISFCSSWKLNSLRDEDFKSNVGKTKEGKTITFSSLAVQIAITLYKSIKVSPERKKLAEEYQPYFSTIKEKCPEFEFSPLYMANLEAWQGNKDEAISQFKNMLCSRPQWYLWNSLGDILEGSLRISCLCKAITMMDDEKFIVKIHLQLAELLKPSEPQQAAYELNKYMETSHNNGWHITQESMLLEQELKNQTASANGKAYYREHVSEAEDFVYNSFPETELEYTGKTTNKQGKPRAELKNRGKHIYLKCPYTPELKKAKVGDIFACRLNKSGHSSTLLTIHYLRHNERAIPQTNTNAEGSKIISGAVNKRDDQEFAFIDHLYYIPKQIVSSMNLKNGQKAKAKIKKINDGRLRVSKIISIY